MRKYRYAIAAVLAFSLTLTAIAVEVGEVGQNLQAGTLTSIRSAAALTTSDVASTTVSVPQNATAIHYGISWTKGGGCTGMEVVPITQFSLGGTVYSVADEMTTCVTERDYSLRIPTAKLGKYTGVTVKALGTGVATSCAIGYRFEYSK